MTKDQTLRSLLDALSPATPAFDPAALIPKVQLPDINRLNPAKWMHERIVRSINSFEEKLDHEHEVGARLVSFGSDQTFHIEDVGYWGPDILTFYGVDRNGCKVELIQHVTQLSVLLIAVAKTNNEPRRIGFALLKDLERNTG
jgi:hypothetical protein